MTQEETYHQTFRSEDVASLSNHLSHQHSVTLIGMKRVGINNFIKFYLQHPELMTFTLSKGMKPLFIHIDLNDLAERDIYPFWILTLKRLVDSIETLPNNEKLVGTTRKLFTESIQLKDLFFTVDGVRKLLSLLVDQNYYPILIFNRFDRMKDAATSEFFANLQSLKEHAKRQMSYIFTSYRSLSELRPDVFSKQAMSVFCSDLYLKPAQPTDASIILQSFEDRYALKLSGKIREEFLSVTGGHVQLIHLSMIKLKESATLPTNREELIEYLLTNEEALLQSEEILDNLTASELEALTNLATIDTTESIIAKIPYLTETGLVVIRENKPVVFSPLIRRALLRRTATKNQQAATDMTKKEYELFTFLQTHEGELCEREAIIEAVWPEYTESGVSDWAVDRLVARVRQKLKAQKSSYEIVTVITRGYKLMKV